MMGDGLDRNAGNPGGLPLWSTGWQSEAWTLASPGDFWGQVADLGPAAGICDHMDEIMDGKMAPRVWLVVHNPDQPELGAAVAVVLARELAAREQVALVVDCDDQEQHLTRWAGLLESEGWIDMARYGTSLAVAGAALAGGGEKSRLLGVGSFAPTDITPTEIQNLLQRLRRQADDVILVVPDNAVRQLWSSCAAIRLLCWDQSRRSATEIDALAGRLAALGQGLTGLVGCGTSAAAAVDAPATEPDLADLVAAKLGPVVAAEPREPAAPQPKGTSSVFLFVTAAAAVIVVILGTYWYRYAREPEAVYSPPAGLAVAVPSVADSLSTEIADQEMAPEQPLVAAAVAEDAEPDGVADTEGDMEQEDVVQRGAAGPFARGVRAPAASAPVTPAVSEPAALSMAPYEGPVGAAGWALHLYSFPLQADAEAEIASLQRRGFAAEARAVEIPAKGGRWWRVYVGSFESRRAAKAAMPQLLTRLRTDWAAPVAF